MFDLLFDDDDDDDDNDNDEAHGDDGADLDGANGGDDALLEDNGDGNDEDDNGELDDLLSPEKDAKARVRAKLEARSSNRERKSTIGTPLERGRERKSTIGTPLERTPSAETAEAAQRVKEKLEARKQKKDAQ